MAILQINAHTIAYDIEGNGVPLVFMHQVATDRRLWRRQRRAFSRRYRMVTVDVLGHGEGTWSPRQFSLERAADAMQTLLMRPGTEPAFLIGVSMGAAVAMQLALNDASLVRGLILVSPWNRIREYSRNLVNRLFRLAETGDMATHTELFLRYSLLIAYLERYPPELERLRALILDQDARAVAYTWAACLVFDLTGRLGDIRVPTLVIAGLNDLFTPPYLARAVAQELADVELEVWQKTGISPSWRIQRALTGDSRLSSAVA